MALAHELAAYAHRLDLRQLGSGIVEQAKTLVLDALACMIAGARTHPARIALAATSPEGETSGEATVVLQGRRAKAEAAVLANGAMLRSLDLMDVYVGRDVTHPSEIVPVALACAEAAGASGRAFLEATIAGISLHMHLADVLELHRHGLHHVGHAAWVAPLVAGRLLGATEEETARALTIMAHQLVVPESFARGQLTNLKALAYPLLAQRGVQAVTLARAGLSGTSAACEHTAELLCKNFGLAFTISELAGVKVRTDLSSVSLKAYPAQYALQPLIAAACDAARSSLGDRLEAVIVRASKRTVERTADPAKYAPETPEAADHSLPFCVAAALLDGSLTVHALENGRWRDKDVRALMAKIRAEPLGEDLGYAVGQQEIELVFTDGGSRKLACKYPARGSSWRSIAERKLRNAAEENGLEAERILAALAPLESAPNLTSLTDALAGNAVPAPHP